MKDKYLWYTDTHLTLVPFWRKRRFFKHVHMEAPKGIFLTGDITNGLFLKRDIELLAKNIKCPIYFVLGNHDYHWNSSFEKVHAIIKELCVQYKHLIWLTESSPIKLNSSTFLIGAEGWYDADVGDASYLTYSLDWRLIKELRQLSTMSDRLDVFRALADRSCEIIAKQLLGVLSLSNCKDIYLLTHFPPFKQAMRDFGTRFEKYWLPYNVNLRLGRLLKKIMKQHKKKHLTVLSGHTHDSIQVHVSRNIFCRVEDSSCSKLTIEERVFI